MASFEDLSAALDRQLDTLRRKLQRIEYLDERE